MYSAILPAVSLTDPFWIAGLGPPEDDDLEAAFATIRQIATAVAKGEEVRIPGFGTFKVAKRAARKARNPQTGMEMMLKASVVPKFQASKTLKDMLN